MHFAERSVCSPTDMHPTRIAPASLNGEARACLDPYKASHRGKPLDGKDIHPLSSQEDSFNDRRTHVGACQTCMALRPHCLDNAARSTKIAILESESNLKLLLLRM